MAQRPVGVELAAVEGDDAGGLLAAMLQGVQAEHGPRRRLLTPVVDADNAAFFLELVVVEGVGANHHACQMATDCPGSSWSRSLRSLALYPGSCFGAAAGFGGRLVTIPCSICCSVCSSSCRLGIGRRRCPLVEGALGQEGAQDIGPAGDQRPRAGLLDDVGLVVLIGHRPGEERDRRSRSAPPRAAGRRAGRASGRGRRSVLPRTLRAMAWLMAAQTIRVTTKIAVAGHHIGQDGDGDVFAGDIAWHRESPRGPPAPRRPRRRWRGPRAPAPG